MATTTSSALPFKTASYHTQTAPGGYAVTKHENAGGWLYIAWHEQTPIGQFDNVAEARSACERHAAGRGTK